MNPVKIYLIHHSHTDIGYTDLQEVVIDHQVSYLHELVARAPHDDLWLSFRWNCETLFCVERFLKEASEDERTRFFDLVRKGKIGLSANYLNFTDLVDRRALSEKVQRFCRLLEKEGIRLRSAMFADINGVSQAVLEHFLDTGVRFLYTNVHCHHGMFPLFQNQCAFFWKDRHGRKLLVWNGEHYNLGNALGIVPPPSQNFMMENLGTKARGGDEIGQLFTQLSSYIRDCRSDGYEPAFFPISVSGVFSDNAPPNPGITETLRAFNQRYGEHIELTMMTLDELGDAIAAELDGQIPEYGGDWTDWWAHGVGSTPKSVKHYREAQRLYRDLWRSDPEGTDFREELRDQIEEALLLFAEHTWGHSASVTDPCLTFVSDIDLRKSSYASRAHELCTQVHGKIRARLGDKRRYYDREGKVKVVHAGAADGVYPVRFYLEVWGFQDIELRGENGRRIVAQVAPHPRGAEICFTDNFRAGESKIYTYREIPRPAEPLHPRAAFRGSERVRDIVNEIDRHRFLQPYQVETDDVFLSYKVGEGLRSFRLKKYDLELIGNTEFPFFTPIYERSPLRHDAYEERRLLGRNLRSPQAERFPGVLREVEVRAQGPIFTEVVLTYELPGTKHCQHILRIDHHLPRIESSLRIIKNYEEAPENLFLSLDFPHRGACFLDKGGILFLPGTEQIPGSCMEYYLCQSGAYWPFKEGCLHFFPLDAPLFSMGSPEHHPIRLCTGKKEDNLRPLFSWLMNNLWETNFSIDLSGAVEFRSVLSFREGMTPEQALRSFEAGNEVLRGFPLRE